AVVLAEALGGDEAGFVAQMNDTARALGLHRTRFRNPHGLPDPDQVTTARDMAKLAVAVLERFPHHYHYFGQSHFRGARNTNALLSQREDVDGFKTGFTRDSGHNLIISAVRNEDRIVAVVLGGASRDSRNRHMSDLVDRGFEVIGQTQATPEPQMVAASAPVRRGPPVWALQIDGFDSPAEAAILSETLVRRSGAGVSGSKSAVRGGRISHSIRVDALDQATARALCADHAALLSIAPRRCKVLSIAKPG
ncbi:MAG: hypothetical protein WBG08_06375, partial [Litorimonas sp.]